MKKKESKTILHRLLEEKLQDSIDYGEGNTKAIRFLLRVLNESSKDEPIRIKKNKKEIISLGAKLLSDTVNEASMLISNQMPRSNVNYLAISLGIYADHFLGEEIAKLKRNIVSIDEADILMKFIIEYSMVDFNSLKIYFQKANKNATRTNSKPIKWVTIKQNLEATLTNRLREFSGGEARLKRIATYTVNNIILADKPIQEESSPYIYDDSTHTDRIRP